MGFKTHGLKETKKIYTKLIRGKSKSYRSGVALGLQVGATKEADKWLEKRKAYNRKK